MALILKNLAGSVDPAYMRLIRRVRTARRGEVAVAMLLTLCLSAATAPPALAISDMQRDLFNLTNADRNDHGLHDLKLNKHISKYAMKHSRKMANRGSIFHSPDLAGVLQGVHWSRAAENVAMAPSGTVEDIEDAWMHSSEHKKNILDRRFDHAAVGVYEEHGTLWATVIFYG